MGTLLSSVCEYEKIWVTRCVICSTSSGCDKVEIWKSASCECNYCNYPKRQCNVKKESNFAGY
jgi:hypothetical protein